MSKRTCAGLLLAAGADLEARDENGERPLSFACSFGNLDCADFLLSKGAAIDAVDKDGLTSLHWAIKNAEQSRNDEEEEDGARRVEGLYECVSLLLKRGAAVHAKTHKGETPMHWAAFVGQTEFARLLLDRGADIESRNKQSATPLHIAVHYKMHACAKMLLDRGADPAAKMGATTNCVRALAALSILYRSLRPTLSE